LFYCVAFIGYLGRDNMTDKQFYIAIGIILVYTTFFGILIAQWIISKL